MKKKRKLNFIKTEHELLLFGISLLMSLFISGCSTNQLSDFFFESNSSSSSIHSTPYTEERPTVEEGEEETNVPLSKQEVDPLSDESSGKELGYSTSLYDEASQHSLNDPMKSPPTYLQYIKK